MNNPLAYFEDIFSSDRSELKKRKMISDYLEFNNGEIISIDEKEGIIVENRYFYDEKLKDWIQDKGTLTFQNIFKTEFSTEVNKIKDFILQKIIEITSTGASTEEFLKQILFKIAFYKEKSDLFYTKYPFIKVQLEELSQFITEQNPHLKLPPTKTIPSQKTVSAEPIRDLNYSRYSFQWELSLEDSETELGKLYDLLVERPPLIVADKKEFINGFTQREVVAGINWLVLSKNKSCSKSSLIYFLLQLIEKSGLIEEPNDFNKKVEYVFRDQNGQKLSNIKQSKSQVAVNRQQKVDTIY